MVNEKSSIYELISPRKGRQKAMRTLEAEGDLYEEVAELRNQDNYYNITARGPMLDRVYSMRYQSYSSEGYIDENSSEKFTDEYDCMPNSKSYLLYYGKSAVGSIRTSLYAGNYDSSIPALEVFKNEIDKSIGLDKKIIELSKFVISPQFKRKGGVSGRLGLLKTAWGDAIKHDVDGVVMAIREEHVKFYERVLNFERVSEVKSIPGLNFKAVLAATRKIDVTYEFLVNKLKVRD